MDQSDSTSGYLTGQLLVAMPTMQDPRFERSVIYMCIHNADGAMGLIVNRALESLTFRDLLSQLELEVDEPAADIAVQYGGPVETGRGFVLHTLEYEQDGTIVVNQKVGLTATVEVLRDIAGDRGPSRAILALGYAGWGPGQLASEVTSGAWLLGRPDEELVFTAPSDRIWELALKDLGIEPVQLMHSGAVH